MISNMATKYKEYVTRMLEAEKELFGEFKKLHDEYSLNQEKLQTKFNEEGKKIVDIVHEWENKLCKQSEKGGYSHFTPKLAEKFQEEVKKHFPLIDHVGIQVQYAPVTVSDNDAFILKKIDLG